MMLVVFVFYISLACHLLGRLYVKNEQDLVQVRMEGQSYTACVACFLFVNV